MNSRLSKYVKDKFMVIANDLLDNPQGLKFKLESAAEKVTTSSVADSLGMYVNDLKILIRMAKCWVSRRYTDLDRQTILYVIVAVIYFVTPTDFVPDFVLGLGYVDDIGVLTWVLNQIKVDLDKFKQWELEKTKIIKKTKKDK